MVNSKDGTQAAGWGCGHQKSVHFLDIIGYEMSRDTKYSYLFQIISYRLKIEEPRRKTRLSVRDSWYFSVSG